MSWVILGALVAIAFALVWRFAKLPRSGVELAIAAMLVALAGYVFQGHAGVPGHPVTTEASAVSVDPALVDTRRAMSGQFGTDAQWLDYADTLTRFGATRLAVTAMRSGIRENPKSPDLWVGLGNALVAHGGGLVGPAATFAFEHAAMLSPQHPAPPFFYGLALAQSGQVEAAGQVWRGLLARTPKDAPWRADLEARLGQIGGAFAPDARVTGPAIP